ncbi:MAG: pantoate--beta-alanine ligase [Candidatus Kapabacteria bacterium]|nr:pantoate--beta-alanine ligase [Ignavibacteriota bacterium]MCW5883580.1 pantoate--beta-alanine ligase [Candidatus Kapabacteria bacterium]
MQIIKTVNEMQKISFENKLKGFKIAVVPTMGFLHEGHLSLIRKGKEVADIVITTLFVNPTQFAPNEDFSKYPRDYDKDFKLCEENGSDYIFFPEVNEMYPKGFNTSILIQGVTEKFEGEFRPTHFQGVATVVAKLFNATIPHFAIFGQKDYQQTLLLKKLNDDLDFGIDIIIAPTIREKDGLAMSSRNTYLPEDLRKKAGVLFFAMEETRKIIAKGETNRKIINTTLQMTLRTVQEIKIDYAAAALAVNLYEPEHFFPGDEIVLLLAVHLGKTRLIDNMIIKIPYRLNDDNFIKS